MMALQEPEAGWGVYRLNKERCGVEPPHPSPSDEHCVLAGAV
jgi:hypothetical protein